MDEIIEIENFFIDNYNTLTRRYRLVFSMFQEMKKKKERDIISNCQHDYIRISECHNDSYYICNKCGHER